MNSLGCHQEEFSKDLQKLLIYIHGHNYNIRCGELQRTPEQQQIYFNQGKTKTLKSYHLQKLAIDLFIFKDGKIITDKSALQHIGNYWESLNPLNRWGGNFKSFLDTPHFERHI